MSWSAWEAVRCCNRRLASTVDSPLSRAVTAAGHRVELLPDPRVADLLSAGAADEAAWLVWLATDDEAEAMPEALATAIVHAGEDRPLPEVEVLHASYDVPGARLLDLVTVMDRLRESCPWDRKQTHLSLAPYLLEETYETLEAIESGDRAHLCEELGDLLLQVLFHARIASEDSGSAEEAGFDIDDVAGGIVTKLVSRHPHVFAGHEVAGVDEVEANWEALKAREKGRSSVLDGIPLGLPALASADKVLGRAARLGVPAAAEAAGLGERLLGLVVEARQSGLDAEQQLRVAVRRLADAVRAAEGR
jgi:XTP/dITP diphosphohydrolase